MADPETPSPLIDVAAPDVAQASSLCTECGLCCMGVLHPRAVLEEDEVAAARAIGLPVLDNTERPLFALPCPKLCGTACTIFGQRPRVCSRYRCQQLRDVEAGVTSLAGALAHVRTAKAMLDRLLSVLPEELRHRSVRSLIFEDAQLVAALDHLPQQQRMELKLSAIALQLYLDKHFRSSKEGRALDMVAITDPEEIESEGRMT